MTRRTELGVTLLEAIVALTIMATCLLALYSWLSTSALALERVRDSVLRLEDQRTAVSVIETINPLENPAGERQVGDLRIRWTSDEIVAQRMGITRANLPSAFDVALFDLNVSVQRRGGAETSFQIRRAGWLLTRPPESEE